MHRQALGAVALSLVAGAGVAAAHDARFPSEVDIGHGVNLETGEHIFHGNVTSPRDSCEGDRKVKVFRKRPGKPDRLTGSDRSSGNGAWSFEVDEVKSGDYYSRASRRRIGPPRHRHVCRQAKSETIFVS